MGGGGGATSFPGLFPFELGRRPNSKGKSPGNEVGGGGGVEVVGGGEVIRGVGLNREGCSMRLLRYLGKTPKTGLKTRINIRRLYYCGN